MTLEGNGPDLRIVILRRVVYNETTRKGCVGCGEERFFPAILHPNRRRIIMKIRGIGCVLLTWMVLLCIPASACTGFVVYGDAGPVYGMNFDNPDREYLLWYDKLEDYKGMYSVFTNWDGPTLTTPVFNEDGFFTTLQMLFPEQPYFLEWIEGEESIANFATWTPYEFDRVQEVRDLVEGATMNHVYVSCHSLFADASGDAMVLELIDGEPVITDIEGKYLVVANFPNAWLDDRPFEELLEIPYGGADRYAVVDAYVKDRVDTFTATDGLHALALAVNENIFSPTAYSMVFDPANRAIYLTLRGDFDRVWKIDMDAKTVETYEGFAEEASYVLSGDGVSLRMLAGHR